MRSINRPGKVERQKYIVRSDLKSNRDKYYVFGDNLTRKGLGGQAKEMRFEPNAIGVATKRSPSKLTKAYFSDKLEEIEAVKLDLRIVYEKFMQGKTIVIPEDGIGTGFAQLKTRSPQILEMINEFFEELENNGNRIHL